MARSDRCKAHCDECGMHYIKAYIIYNSEYIAPVNSTCDQMLCDVNKGHFEAIEHIFHI